MSDGVLLIDKPAGKTSHDIVAAVRRDLDAFRGHNRQRDDVTLVVIKVAPAANIVAEPHRLPQE